MRTDRSVLFVRENESNYLKYWAGIVAGSQSGSTPKRAGKDGTISASVVSAAISVPAARAKVPVHIPVEARPASNPTCGQTSAIPLDLANMMAAAIERSFEANERALGGDRYADAAHLGKSSSGICNFTSRRERRSDEFWRCGGCEKGAVGIGFVEFASTAIRGEVRTHVWDQFAA